MEVKIRVRGVDRHIRNLAALSDGSKEAAIDGVRDAARYLLDKVLDKIGTYQQTGGSPHGKGPWPKLLPDTIFRKMRKWGVKDKPLYASGDLLDSFEVVYGGKGRISASVGSNSPYLIHHVYGAPRANVPQRDPILVTADEERDECNRIIEAAINERIQWDNR